MKTLATSDWHIDASTDGVRRREEILDSVLEVVELAVKERVDLFVFLGDLCNPDGWCAFDTAAIVIEVATRLRQENIRSIWLSGNHDVVEDGLGTTMLSPLKAAAAVPGRAPFIHVFEGPGWVSLDTAGRGKVGGAKIDFLVLPFTPRQTAYDPEKMIVEFAQKRRGERPVVLGHLGLEGIKPGSETNDMPRGRDVFWPLDAIKHHLPDAVLIAGHYHEGQVYRGVNIVGSLARLTHGEEANEPGVVIFEL